MHLKITPTPKTKITLQQQKWKKCTEVLMMILIKAIQGNHPWFRGMQKTKDRFPDFSCDSEANQCTTQKKQTGF